MTKEFFQELFDYTYWAHRRVWACVVQLSEEQFTEALDSSVGSLHEQCLHTMSVEFWWFRFLATDTLEFLQAEQYPARATLRAKWDETEEQVRAYLETLTPDELQREVRPDFWDEGAQPIQVWQALFQVANHSTDHRAQTLASIHRLGGPTVGQDYLAYLFEKQGLPDEA